MKFVSSRAWRGGGRRWAISFKIEGKWQIVIDSLLEGIYQLNSGNEGAHESECESLQLYLILLITKLSICKLKHEIIKLLACMHLCLSYAIIICYWDAPLSYPRDRKSYQR